MRLVGSVLVVFLLVLASCAGGAANPALSTVAGNSPELAQLALPSPSELPVRHGAAVIEEVTGGAFFLEPYPIANIDGEGSTAIFQGNWEPDVAGPREPAYCMYGFQLSGQSPYSLELEWSGDSPACWAGLANYDADLWEWYPAGEPLLLPRNAAPYLNSSNQFVVMIVVTDRGDFQLNRLWINDDEGMGFSNLFFLHHSTGEGIINGGVRDAIAAYNGDHGTSFEFWDHGYNEDGLCDAAGNSAGCYNIPGDNTDPDGLHYLWTSANQDAADCRELILANHDVIAFKSCFPAAAIDGEAMLAQYQDYYNEMADVFDTYPDHLFVVLGFPPLHPDETNAAEAALARQFTDWLASPAYLDGHPNVVCFNLFDQLASDGSDGPADMLRNSYQQDFVDSHPNDLANSTIAPVFADFLCDAAVAFSE